MTKNSNLSNIQEYIDEVCNTICEVSRMSGLYLDFVPWNLSVVFFTNYPPCLSLLVYIYIAGDSIGLHMESAMGPESICVWNHPISNIFLY